MEENEKQDSTEPKKLGRPRVREPNKPKKQRRQFEGSIVRVTVALSEDIWKRLKIVGIWENRTLEDVINEACEDLALRAERQRAAEEQLTQKLIKKKKN